MNEFTERELEYLSQILEIVCIIEGQHRDSEGQRTFLDNVFIDTLQGKLERMKSDRI